MVLVVEQGELKQAKPFESISFTEIGVLERKHIQEWIRHNPKMFGEELMVISIEFNQFEQIGDRPDVLALDRNGNLVIIELKRDSFAAYADLQAIRYAALLSTVTVDDIVPMYLYYCQRYLNQPEQTFDVAKSQLEDFINDSAFTQLSNNPRIILCAENFSPAITTTVLWLNKVGLNVACIRIQPYLVDNQIIIVPTKIIPTPEASQYTVRLQRKEQLEAEEQQRRNRPRTMGILIENEILKAGDVIHLKASLPTYISYQQDDKRFLATIIGGKSQSVIWANDNQEYAISALTRKIFNSFNANFNRTPNGNAHWTNAEGVALWQLAENYLGSIDVSKV
ncbi:hypothetical protein [Spirosoma gilvum]